MLPMCYPADHDDGAFIPNWAMWFVVELEEYLARTGDRRTVEALQPRVLKLVSYLRRFENADGLLEKLPSWVFVEWSAANNFVQPLNYPTNMLWAGTQAAAGRLYSQPELTARADKLRETIRRQSFDGEFFVDNAELKDGKMVPTRNRSETCQYYACFFDVATQQRHGELYRKLIEEFGPRRKEQNRHPEIHPSNSFIGNMLRVEVLSRLGRGRQILDESIDYLMYMAERTGTLWEHAGAEASCNHGFASHIVHTLYRDVLGVYRIDPVGRALELRFADTGLEWCEGRIPVGPHFVSLRWMRTAEGLDYWLEAPADYSVKIMNLTNRPLRRR
jgi:alpha-L-rhamnosidase